MLFFQKHCLLQWMKNALKIKQFEKLSAVRLLDFFKTSVHRERKLFFKVLSTLVLQQNCICRLYSEKWRPSNSWPHRPLKKRSDLATIASETRVIQRKSREKTPILILSCKEPTRVSFPISHRQTIKKLSLNQCSWKKNMQGKILSVGLSALKIQKA